MNINAPQIRRSYKSPDVRGQGGGRRARLVEGPARGRCSDLIQMEIEADIQAVGEEPATKEAAVGGGGRAPGLSLLATRRQTSSAGLRPSWARLQRGLQYLPHH